MVPPGWISSVNALRQYMRHNQRDDAVTIQRAVASEYTGSVCIGFVVDVLPSGKGARYLLEGRRHQRNNGQPVSCPL